MPNGIRPAQSCAMDPTREIFVPDVGSTSRVIAALDHGFTEIAKLDGLDDDGGRLGRGGVVEEDILKSLLGKIGTEKNTRNQRLEAGAIVGL